MSTEPPPKPPVTVAPTSAQQMFAMDSGDFFYEDDQSDESIPQIQKLTKANNILPIWGNQSTMNLNALVLENIVDSPYFKNRLVDCKLWSQVMDEIYYNVTHLEPWERGTRKTTGQTGMCGGVRGVGAGGVVSTAYCCMFKMFTLKLTRKQLVGMINHAESPYIRGLGFMYIRYCQPPSDLWDWLEPYLDDEDEIDPKAGGGDRMTVGQMVKLLLTKLDWYGTLFPRIPVPIQKVLETKFRERTNKRFASEAYAEARQNAERVEQDMEEERRKERDEGTRDRDTHRTRSRERDRQRSRDRDLRRDRDEKRRSRERESRRDRSRERRDSRERKEKKHERTSGRSSRSRSRSPRRRGGSRERKKESRSRRQSREKSKEKEGRKSREKEERKSREKEERKSREKEERKSREKEEGKSREKEERKSREKEETKKNAKEENGKTKEKEEKLGKKAKRKKCGHYRRKRERERKRKEEEEIEKQKSENMEKSDD